MRKHFLFAIFFTFAFGLIQAQTTREEVFDKIEKTGAVYFAYPSDDIKPETPAPKGYEPFYISHFSRHGSRYLISDEDYKKPIAVFKKAYEANALTDLGKDVYQRLQVIWEEAEGHGGDLSPLGERQQRDIAERMYRKYPQAFDPAGSYSARSTLVVRCVLSMDAFCERLKELDPKLKIQREASNKYVKYLNHHTKEAIEFRTDKDKKLWRKQYEQFEQEHVKPARLINSLFSDTDYIYTNIYPAELMWQLYWIASDMQNVEANVCLYDIFEKQELFDLWQCLNYRHYVNDGNSALSNGLMMENAKPVVRNILNSANEIIESNGKGGTFRFAHDGNLIPLSQLLHLEGAYTSISEPEEFYKAWSDFKIAPMAGNIQMIFYRKKGSDDILVKFLQHENEVAIPPVKTDNFPYYNWKEIEAFYNSLLGNKY